LLIIVALISTVGVTSGYLLLIGRIGTASRVFLGLGAISLIIPGTVADVVGFGLILVGFGWGFFLFAVKNTGIV
jgi:hypothetical protein